MASRIPREFVDQVLQRVDIVDVVNSRVPLRKAGKDYQACCPFHDEKTPSFTVSQNKQFYYCFGCGAHGSALGFLIDFEGMNFPEAVEALAHQVGMEVPREVTDRAPDQDLRPIYEILSKASSFYRTQLRQHPTARIAVNYLKQRGLDGETAARFDIGYAPPGWNSLLNGLVEAEKVSPQLLLQAGLITQAEHGNSYDRMRDRIIFPIRDIRGRVVGFGGRVMGDEKPKYLNSPETPVFHKGRQLYGLYEMRQALRRPDRLLVVEGYMDVVALGQQGINYAVATLGTATTVEHLEMLFRQTPNVVFCFDGDRAGRAAAWKALETVLPMMTQEREVRFLFLPDGDDPDSLVRSEGPERFEQRVTKALPLSEYLLGYMAEQVDLESLDGRVRFAESVKPYIGRLPDGLLKKMLWRSLAERSGVALEDLDTTIIRRLSGYRPNPRQHQKLGQHPVGRMTPLRQAVALLLNRPQLALLPELPEEWVAVKVDGIDLLNELMTLIQRSPDMDVGRLLEHWRDSELFRHLHTLSVSGLSIPEEGYEAEFRDCLARLEREARQQEFSRLTTRMAGSGLNEEEIERVKQLSELIR